MTQALVTVSIPFPDALARQVDEALDGLGNPAAGRVRQALDAGAWVHFASMVVVHGAAGGKAHLLLEASVDGSETEAMRALAQDIGGELRGVLAAAGEHVATESLAGYLDAHRIDAGPGWGCAPGVLFSGTPGMSVRRIRKERDLAAWLEGWLAQREAQPGEGALDVLELARSEVFKDVDLKQAFVAEPVPLLGPKPALAQALRGVLGSLACSLLWPLLALPALGALGSRLVLERSFLQVVYDFCLIFGAEVVCAGGALWLIYRHLRRKEEADAPGDDDPQEERTAELMALENRTRQNHLAAVSTLKGGLVRALVLRFVLSGVHAAAAHQARPGHLSGIGSIHFARWLVLPGTGKLLFFSNYDGSWGSYLEDFIARAAEGLSAIWSNTQGFPRTRILGESGASDGERFKRWARRQQVPTRFWYAAYPDLTTERIRRNAAIRHGFAAASTEAAASEWLRLVSFPIRVESEVRSEEVPTLAFGGLKKLNYSHCLVVRLADRERGRAWLRAIEPHIRYGESRPERDALVVALSASGMEKVMTDPLALGTFPSAFQHGMTAPWRARALGDEGGNAPQRWWWGGDPDQPADAVLILYTDDAEELRQQVARRREQLRQLGHDVIHEVVTHKLPEKGGDIREPFGFIDGISQPIMRGTRKWVVQRNSIHVVEPGELVLGYPDNLKKVSPTPRHGGWDLGKDGTFLVVRQLEQDVGGFNAYLDQAAAQIPAQDARVPPAVRGRVRDWLAAKMVGRWEDDGSSLVRHPTPPWDPHRTTVKMDNDFLFGAEDPDGERCPFGAHIRRANPRDSFEPGSTVQVNITNRHRIFRVGRSYPPQNGTPNPGLLFMCVNADIEGQFEFLQQSWIHGRSFHGLADEIDPVASGPGGGAMTIPTERGPLRLTGLQSFVTVRGGGYFFMPGRSALRRLLEIDAPDAPAQDAEPYTAPWWLPGAHLQTIGGSLKRSPAPAYSRQRWDTPDGDFIDVDFAGAEDAPRLLVLFHGLEGSSLSEYARAICAHALADGRWRLAVPHFRGCSGEPNRKARAYHSGDSEEIDWILRRFAGVHPAVHAAGVSLGANALLKWLGERGADAGSVVRRAAAVSAPFRLAALGSSLERGFNLVYGKYFLAYDLRAKALAKLRQFPGVLDEQRVRSAGTLRQFDDAVTAPLHGFAGAADYYERSSAEQFLPGIRVPTLLLNARNDPFLRDEPLRAVEARRDAGELPSELVLEFPKNGGHGGFPGRHGWLARRVLRFLAC